ncbi:MAG: VWA domain-containing protein [Lysinibacillus sp.]|nr:VWA domain-containing protein [Lysinibacillus sp.]
MLVTLIFPLAVLLYYFFRKKYKDKEVSSTLFWEEVMQETRVSPYLKHLQRNALFYLQMLALLLFVFALMNPYIKTKEVGGNQLIWIVDTSASMLAGKEMSTFEKHKEEMKSLVAEVGERPLTIITTGSEPKTVLRQETNVQRIQKTIDELAITYEEEHLTKALDMANAYIGDKPTTIYLFTDAVSRSQLPIERENVKWIVKGADTGLENIAITRFAATNIGNETIALIQLKNETNKNQTVQLSLLNDEGEQLLNKTITLKAQEELTNTFEALPNLDVLTATIKVKDDYKADNTMMAIVGSNPFEVAIGQDMHKLVQTGFQSLGTDVKIVPETQLKLLKESIVVTNQAELLEQKEPIVLIGRDDELEKEVNGFVEVSQDELFAFSSLKDVYVRAVYPPFDGFQTIAMVGEEPFIQRSPKGDIVILADIQSTDWPLHPSFPLFLWSIQNELVEGKTSLGVFSPNEQRAVSLVAGDWSIYTAEGDYISSFENAQEFQAPSKPGLYVVRSENEVKPFIVQLPQKERTIEEGTSFELGKISIGEEEIANQSIAKWIALVILIILVVEWEVQRRRGFAN